MKEKIIGTGLFMLQDCSAILGAQLAEVIHYVFFIVRVAVPVLVVILVMTDFVKAVAAQEEKGMKEAQAKAIKRIVIGVLIFFVPTIVNLLLWLIGHSGTACTFSFF